MNHVLKTNLIHGTCFARMPESKRTNKNPPSWGFFKETYPLEASENPDSKEHFIPRG